MEKIIEKDICEVSSQGFINYALETIKARAIPDVRDGLKPVARRVIYAMHELNLYPDKPYKKSARIVGDAMGKYHPHGDSSIYGALVTSAQVFREQLPLIDGYGNFGSVDDSAAAMRYCVTGDTLVNTNNGLIPIKDIVQNSELNSDNPIDIKIQSIGNVMNKASMFFNSGEHKIIEIVLKNGMSIKGSYNHPLLVVEKNNKYNDYKWKTLDKITTNDIIVVNCCRQTFSRKNNINSIELDFLCAKLKNQPNEYYNKLKKQYDLNENELTNFIEKYNNNDTIQHVINLVLQSNYVIQLEFLKKIFDLYENGFYIGENNKFISNNKDLIKTIQILLLNFNQYSTIYNYSKNSNLYVIEKIEKEQHENNYIFENIEKINYLDREIVYSIRVDSDCHSFVGNGFINHNTESRLTPYGAYLLEGLNENAVDFVSNYDDTEKEPEVLPAFTPNLLVNGEFGIAVGYQPNIPPHNYNELIDGIIYEMDNPKATTKDLMKFVKGPDFPEGAIIDPIELELCYETGKGTIPMRAKLLVETLPLGKSQIVITEVPYLTSKEKLVSDIAKALSPEEYCFDSVTDETNKNGTRIIISFDKGANIEKAIDVLCKKTQVQTNFSYNFVAIYNNEPITFSLKQYFDVFIETKLVVLKRIFINRLEKEKKNNEKLKAIHIGAIKIDEVIKIIKTSKTAKIAKERLMETLGVSEYGAQVIFEMRLSSLINTEVINIEKDIKASDKRIKELEKSINNEKQLRLKLKEKLIETKELFGQPRKTKIQKFEKMKTVVQEEEFVLQAVGKKYKKMSSTYKGDKGICLKTKSSTVINTFLNNGDFARYLGNQIKSEENYDIIGLFDDNNTKNIFFVTNEGQVKQTSFDDYKQIALDKYVISMKLNEKEKIIACFACDDDSEVYIETKNGYAIRFFTNEVRPTGRIAGGMRGINLEKGDVAIKAGPIKKGTPQASYKQQKRAGKGNKIK